MGVLHSHWQDDKLYPVNKHGPDDLIIMDVLCYPAAYNGGMAKFQDPAKTIYNDSLRKKYLINGSPFALNGIQPNLSNGHVPHAQSNGSLPQYGTATQPNGGSHMNISVNRLSELPDGEYKQNISLPPPPMIPPPNGPPDLYDSPHGRVSPCPSDLSEAGECSDTVWASSLSSPNPNE